jgi:LacI family transcriptional regulator
MGVTIVDIAKKAGVSVATVSRVLNGKPDVSELTAEAVRKTIEELNYSPNAAARGLVYRKSQLFAMMVPDIRSPIFPELARGIMDCAKTHGYSVMLFDTDHDEMVRDTIQLLQSKQVDGAILSFDSANREELKLFKNAGLPIVQVYRKSPVVTGPTISIDNVQSGYDATRYLILQGHTVIGHITTGSETQSGDERLLGYRKALDEAGIEFRTELVQVGEHSYASGIDCMDRLFDYEPGITAVFCTHDLMAVGAYKSVNEHGLSVPDDVSIVGHDNIDLSRMMIPSLTTIDTEKFRLGQEAARLLFEVIRGEVDDKCERVFTNRLVVRDSVRSPNGEKNESR